MLDVFVRRDLPCAPRRSIPPQLAIPSITHREKMFTGNPVFLRDIPCVYGILYPVKANGIVSRDFMFTGNPVGRVCHGISRWPLRDSYSVKANGISRKTTDMASASGIYETSRVVKT